MSSPRCVLQFRALIAKARKHDERLGGRCGIEREVCVAGLAQETLKPPAQTVYIWGTENAWRVACVCTGGVTHRPIAWLTGMSMEWGKGCAGWTVCLSWSESSLSTERSEGKLKCVFVMVLHTYIGFKLSIKWRKDKLCWWGLYQTGTRTLALINRFRCCQLNERSQGRDMSLDTVWHIEKFSK